MPPPNLKDASPISLQIQMEDDLTPSLKPRPTVLFLSPRKRRRCDDNNESVVDAHIVVSKAG
jgi:hypothetical protein